MQTREMKDRTARTPDTALYAGVSKIQDVLALVALFIMAVGLFERQGVITRVQFLLLRTAARSIRVFLEKAPPKFYVLPFRVYVYIARLYCTRIRLRLCKRINVKHVIQYLHNDTHTHRKFVKDSTLLISHQLRITIFYKFLCFFNNVTKIVT